MSGSKGYGAGARLLGAGIALTGVITFAYFSVASHVLDDADYTRIALLWSILFVTVTVIYRPVEQLLARSIPAGRDVTRSALRIQAAFATAAVVGAVLFRGAITDELLGGEDALWAVLVAAIVFYAVSYYARGWMAGNRRFELYGGLVFIEATARLLFALGVAVGLATGQVAVALGMAAAPLLSLIVVPLAFRRYAPPASGDPSGGGGRFAAGVLVVMLAEQTIINAAVLTVGAGVTAGLIFNALLIARAPLQLFQAIQGSLLPHLAGLPAGSTEFARAIRVTVLAIAAFAGAVALGLLVLGPWAMDLLFEDGFRYPRAGLVLVAVGMGAHLVAGTLNQAALARDRAGTAAACWALAAVLFVLWMVGSPVEDELLRAEIGYASSTALLSGLLLGVYHRSPG